MISINVEKRFSSVKMAFTMEIASKRIILFGPSGSGKSTLLKLMTGLCRPDHGRITVGNRTIFARKQGIDVPVHLRKFGYLPQDYSLFPHLTVRANILYGLKAQKIPYQEKVFKQVVEKLAVADKLSNCPAELSGGQQQRVALARIMLIQPRALLLDEPFSALDTSVRESLRDLVSDLTDEAKIPALLVTHDLEEALIFGQEIAIIVDGRVIEYGKKEDVFQSPCYVETARLLDFQLWPLVQYDDCRLTTASGEIFTFSGHRPQDAQYVGIRPENIMLVREDRPLPEGGRENLISGVVISLRHRARYVRIVMHSNRGEEYVIHTPEHVIQVMQIYKGKKIRISLKRDSLVLCRNKLT
jgi:molybdate transport system ATP-binding protein